MGSVLLFALFEVCIKKGVGEVGGAADSLLLLGLLGAFTALTLWPGVFIEDALYVASVGGHPLANGSVVSSQEVASLLLVSWSDVTFLITNAALDAVFNGLLVLAIALVSPLFASMGSMLLIPTGIVVDSLSSSKTLWDAWTYAGSVLIVIGFIVLSLPPTIRRNIASRCRCTRGAR
jgi:hypothetical protein